MGHPQSSAFGGLGGFGQPQQQQQQAFNNFFATISNTAQIKTMTDSIVIKKVCKTLCEELQADVDEWLPDIGA